MILICYYPILNYSQGLLCIKFKLIVIYGVKHSSSKTATPPIPDISPEGSLLLSLRNFPVKS